MVALITPLAEPSGPATLQLVLLPLPPVVVLPLAVPPLGPVGLLDPPQAATIMRAGAIAVKKQIVFIRGLSGVW
jgi:hypothetical protein